MSSANRTASQPKCGTWLPQALCIFHLTFAACALVPTSATENANAQIARVLLIFINHPPVLFNV